MAKYADEEIDDLVSRILVIGGSDYYPVCGEYDNEGLEIWQYKEFAKDVIERTQGKK